MVDADAVTRLAPSPTGSLHLGNARTFLVNWALARQRGWKVVLRVDDLDSPRVKAGADRAALDILAWLGIDWDSGPVYESQFLAAYHQRLDQLARAGAIYPCRCTRSQIAAASLSAPHADEHELRYPGTCRPVDPAPVGFPPQPPGGVAWRFRVPDGMVRCQDQVAGWSEWNVQQHVGDFLVTNKQGIASYQLAVVVDDFLAGVNQVVRGDDLLSSTPRQILLQEQLGIPPCAYWHLPIVIGADGQRLAKRHGGWTIEGYRAAGVTADRIRGLIGSWSGLETRRPLSAGEFLQQWSIDLLPKTRVVFSEADHNWLMAGARPGDA